MAILTVNNIKKMFGTDVIIQDITFEVQKGDRVGLVGINGSGKTTLFKVLNGRIYGGRRHLYPGARNVHRLHGAACLPRYGKTGV